mgnify:CR=1 FL=1
MNLIETRRGLPNTCCVCGKDPGESWFAASEDQAIAGQGRCARCAPMPVDPQPAEPDVPTPPEPTPQGDPPSGESSPQGEVQESRPAEPDVVREVKKKG